MSRDLDSYRLKDSDLPQTPKPKRSPFIKGPIPLNWIQRAAELPGSSPFLLGIALWYQAGLERSRTDLRLTRKLLSVFGLKRRTAYNALTRLESAGLVSVERPPGSCCVVNLLDNGR
jgi:hypothetical protein